MELSKLLYTIPESAGHLGVGRTTIYKLINSGQLKVVRIGKRGLRISAVELKRFSSDCTSTN